jgi:hypothetical protein
MPKSNNIYDLVERAAARRRVPRLELWEEAAQALAEKTLPVINGFEKIFPERSPKTYYDWFPEFRAAVRRGSDPNDFRHILKRVIVSISHFSKWLKNAPGGPRGPQPGTTGYSASDRTLFPEIDELTRTGQARSPFDAALQLARQGKVKVRGPGTPESRAKRVATRYRRERGPHQR